jgi:hypothetical protein
MPKNARRNTMRIVRSEYPHYDPDVMPWPNSLTGRKSMNRKSGAVETVLLVIAVPVVLYLGTIGLMAFAMWQGQPEKTERGKSTNQVTEVSNER